MGLKEIHPLLKQNRNNSGISLENLISLYEWMVKCGKLEKGSAGYKRLNQLKLRYSKGERYVKSDE
mgnify:CR=1 FL=1